MTLISSIITDAYREGNMLPLGKAPTDNQVAEALRLFNGLVTAIYGNTAGERLTEWPLGNFDQDPEGCEFYSPLNSYEIARPTIDRRILVLNLLPMTVWFSPRPEDGARMGIADPFNRLSQVPVTLDGNGRPIEGAATLLLDQDGTFREWFYRADLASWAKLSPLAATDDNPFPAAFDNMFIIMLAMRLNPRYGRTLDDQSALILKENKRDFVNRYLQSRPLEIDDSVSWPFMSRQSYDLQRSFTSQRGFDRGNYWE